MRKTINFNSGARLRLANDTPRLVQQEVHGPSAEPFGERKEETNLTNIVPAKKASQQIHATVAEEPAVSIKHEKPLFFYFHREECTVACSCSAKLTSARVL